MMPATVGHRVLTLAVLILLASSCGSDETSSANTDSSNTDSSNTELSSTTAALAVPTEPGQQIASVTIDGDPLPAFPEGVQITDSSNDPAVGLVAPTLSGTNFDGSAVVVSPDGTPRVIMFVAHWCSHCQREIPVVVDLINEGKLPDGLEILAVSTAVQEGQPKYPPQDWLIDENWPGPVMRDSAEFDAVRSYGAGGFPYTVYLNGENEVVARSAGELGQDELEQLWLATAES